MWGFIWDSHWPKRGPRGNWSLLRLGCELHPAAPQKSRHKKKHKKEKEDRPKDKKKSKKKRAPGEGAPGPLENGALEEEEEEPLPVRSLGVGIPQKPAPALCPL